MELSFEIFEQILETADLFDEDYGFRASYKGRGWAPEGFGLTVDSSDAMARFLVAAGLVAEHCETEGYDSFDAIRFASAMRTDSMGLGTILYWPGWTITDVPADFGSED